MYFLSAVILAVFASTTSALPPCVCTRDLKPVCGTDGVTYNNQCLLDCARTRKPDLELARSGRCAASEDMCICPLNYSPVCGSDGQSYPNECSLNCQARSKDLKMVHPGDCMRAKRDTVLVSKLGKSCPCPRNMKPVCGSDGVTYSNECLLSCAGDLTVVRQGPC